MTTTAKTTRTRKAPAKATPAAEVKELKLRMTLAITLPDPAKWERADVTEVDPAKLAEALKAQGVPAELAEQTAAAAVAQVGKTGANVVRDEIKAYIAAEVAKLAKLTAAGAVVTLAAAHA